MAIYRLFSDFFDDYHNGLNLFTVLKIGFERLFNLIFMGISLVFLLSCSAQETAHGNKIDEIDIHKIQLNKTTKNDIKFILGPPSFQGSFDSGKIYYSNIKRQTPLGRKAVINSSNLYVFLFDENDILLEMKKVESLPSSITYDKEKTEAPGVSLGILEQIFFNLQRRQNTE